MSGGIAKFKARVKELDLMQKKFRALIQKYKDKYDKNSKPSMRCFWERLDYLMHYVFVEPDDNYDLPTMYASFQNLFRFHFESVGGWTNRFKWSDIFITFHDSLFYEGIRCGGLIKNQDHYSIHLTFYKRKNFMNIYWIFPMKNIKITYGSMYSSIKHCSEFMYHNNFFGLVEALRLKRGKNGKK